MLKKDLNTCLKLIKNNNNIEKIIFENQCCRDEEKCNDGKTKITNIIKELISKN